MPKDLKKRQRGGRSKKKNDAEDQDAHKADSNNAEFHEQDFVPLGDVPKVEASRSAGPSGSQAFANAPQVAESEEDPAAPFGFVDPDIKAYFRSVDERLREWEALGLAQGEDTESELEGMSAYSPIVWLS